MSMARMAYTYMYTVPNAGEHGFNKVAIRYSPWKHAFDADIKSKLVQCLVFSRIIYVHDYRINTVTIRYSKLMYNYTIIYMLV